METTINRNRRNVQYYIRMFKQEVRNANKHLKEKENKCITLADIYPPPKDYVKNPNIIKELWAKLREENQPGLDMLYSLYDEVKELNKIKDTDDYEALILSRHNSNMMLLSCILDFNKQITLEELLELSSEIY